jgi:excisionase family DNA binding protein
MTPLTSTPPERLAVDVAEAAAATGLSTRHLRREIADGNLRAIRCGRRVLIPTDALRDYIAGRPTAARNVTSSS